MLKPWSDDRLAANGRAVRENFTDWFGGSKVVDVANKPLVVYHGTNVAFDTFDMSKALDGAHWFTPDSHHAASFGEEIKAVYLRIDNPLEINQGDLDRAWDKEHPDGEQDDRNLLPRDFVGQFIKQARKQGHDGLVIRDMGDRDIASDMYLPLDANQIKSSIGNWGAKDPDISHSRRKVSVEMEGKNTAVAKAGSRVVGRAHAWLDSRGDFVIMNAEVRPAYRRRGIASQMYQTIEASTGKQLKPAVSLSDDAFELWKSFRPEAVAQDLRHWKEQLIGARVVKNNLPGVIIKASGGSATMQYDEAQPNGTQSTLLRSNLNAALAAAGSAEIDFNGASVQHSERDITETPAFRKWFGNSKVTNVKGKPLIVYHGTDKVFTEFKKGQGVNFNNAQRLLGFFFAEDESYAKQYGKGLVAVHLAISNPFHAPSSRIDAIENASDRNARAWVKSLKDKGYDGIRFGEGAVAEWVAFGSDQIKSATSNTGLHLKSNPLLTDQDADLSLLYAHQARMAVEKVIKKNNPKVALC